MRALRFHQFGLENLRLEDIPKPQPQAGEVLVRVLASSVNPSDVKNVQGAMSAVTKLPRIPGRDFAGIVEEGDANLIGQEVWGTGGDIGFTRDGTAAEYVVVPERAVIPKPPRFTSEQAASLGLNIVTAWAALFDRAGLKQRETLLVVGASGGVGHAAVDLACWAGAKVIAVDRIDDKSSRAHIFLNSESSTFAEDLKKAVSGGVNVVFDTVSGPMFEVGLNALAKHGRMVEITVKEDHQVKFDLLRFYRDDLQLHGLNTLNLNATDCAVILEEVARAIETKWLTPREVEAHPLSDGVEAYKLTVKGGKKRVIVMK
ncbi:MAG TPA: zinc-binding alcohol dehydrogenase family protein [Terriglobales bacterium]|nr:zinc-binding alcohol dehydrogenase family protein [Terriglobales bacterium]